MSILNNLHSYFSYFINEIKIKIIFRMIQNTALSETFILDSAILKELNENIFPKIFNIISKIKDREKIFSIVSRLDKSSGKHNCLKSLNCKVNYEDNNHTKRIKSIVIVYSLETYKSIIAYNLEDKSIDSDISYVEDNSK